MAGDVCWVREESFTSNADIGLAMIIIGVVVMFACLYSEVNLSKWWTLKLKKI